MIHLDESFAKERVLLAFSGGVDSTVLLHLLKNLMPAGQLRALHINHDFYPQAQVWQAHCEALCQAWDLPCLSLTLQTKPPAGESLEAWARDQRRAIFAQHLHSGEILMTAQHADDQAETILLQLIRGAGPKGLSAMPASITFAAGTWVRPLLSYSKQNLIEYAQAHQLNWVTDHSNTDLQFDRNYLRDAVIPLLKSRWPSIEQTLSRSAAHCAQAQDLIEVLIEPVYQNCQGSKQGTLSIQALSAQNPLVQRALIRHWLADKKFPMIGHKKFEKIFEDLIPARADAQPLIAWDKYCIRRYRDDLYALTLEEAQTKTHRTPGRKKAFQAQGIPPWERLDSKLTS